MSKKQPTVKAAKSQSAYSGVNNYSVGLDGFSNATASKNGDTISTSSSLAPGLQGIYNTTTDGLGNNLNTISENPTQQLQDLNAGNNSFYNLNAANNQKLLDQNNTAVLHRTAQSGIDNSTVAGGLYGENANNALLQDLNTRQAALQYQNQQANTNIGTQANLLNGLYGFVHDPSTLANQNLQTGLGSQDQVGMFNAQQQQEANKANAELAYNRQQATNQMWGQIANAGIQGLGALAMAPVSGGGSLASLGASKVAGLLGFSPRGIQNGTIAGMSPFISNPL